MNYYLKDYTTEQFDKEDWYFSKVDTRQQRQYEEDITDVELIKFTQDLSQAYQFESADKALDFLDQYHVHNMFKVFRV